jgi:hypothetical protein
MDDSHSNKPERIRRPGAPVRLPLVSGKASASAVVLAFCCLLAVVLILPLARGVQPWIRFEIILGLWWLVWVIALTTRLYSGARITDDHTLGKPRNWFAGLGKVSTGGEPTGCSPWVWLLPDAGEGCAIAAGVILAVAAVLLSLWLLIEVVIPVLAFIAYFLIRGMLAHVVNDVHGCKGNNLLRAVLWGSLWATLYTAPLALIIWLAHLIHAKPGV